MNIDPRELAAFQRTNCLATTLKAFDALRLLTYYDQGYEAFGLTPMLTPAQRQHTRELMAVLDALANRIEVANKEAQ